MTFYAEKGGVLTKPNGQTTSQWTQTYGLATGTIEHATPTPNKGYHFVGWYDGSSTALISNDINWDPVRGDDGLWPSVARYIARFAPNTYTIHYDVAGGSGSIADQAMTYDERGRLAAVHDDPETEEVTGISRTGYTFKRWVQTLADNTKAYFDDMAWVLNLTDVDNSVVTLVAEWEPITYTVVFNAGIDGATGSVLAPAVNNRQTYHYGELAALAKNDFARNGYIFRGWATSLNGSKVYDDCQDVINLTTVQGGEILLFGVWEKNHYTVTFENPEVDESDATKPRGEISSADPQNIIYLGHATNPQTNASSNKYKFGYWSYTITLDDGSTLEGTTTEPSAIDIEGTTVFVAHWVARSFSVSYEPGEHGNFASGSSGYTYFSNLTWSSKVPAYDGGLDTAATNNKNLGNPKAKTGWRFLYWQWKDINGNILRSDQTALPQYISDYFSGTEVLTEGEIVFTAVFDSRTQALAFDLNGGFELIKDSCASRAYPTGDPVVLPDETMVRNYGYTLVGWSLKPSGPAIYKPGQTIAMFGVNTTLYAIWQARTYAVYFDTTGGSFDNGRGPLNSDNKRTGVHWVDKQLLKDIPDPVKPGFTFMGWYEVLGGGYDVAKVSNAMAFEGIAPLGSDGIRIDAEGTVATLYAKWKELISTIKYIAVISDPTSPTGFREKPDAGKLSQTKESILRTSGTPAGSVASPNKGFDFIKWVDANGNEVHFERLYRIEDDGAGNQTIVWLDEWELVPTKEAYDAYAGKFNMWANPTIFYAVFYAHTYTINFDPNGCTGSIDPMHAQCGETYNLPYNIDPVTARSKIEREGYNFLGWNTSPDGLGTDYEDGQAVTNLVTDDGGAITLYAMWQPGTFTLTFDSNGANMEAIRRYYDAGDKLYLLKNTVFKRTGYTFGGWCTEASGKGAPVYKPSALYTMPGHNTTMYAVWIPINYTIAFEPGAPNVKGSMDKISTVYDKETVLPEANYKRTGYDFAGWALSVGGTVKYLDGDTVSKLTSINNATVTLFAIWAPRSNLVSFVTSNPDRGTVIAANQHVLTGSSPDMTAVSATPKDGYGLLCWMYRTTLEDDEGTVLSSAVFDPSTFEILGPTVFTAIWGKLPAVIYLPGVHGDFELAELGKTLFEELTPGQTPPAFAGKTDDKGRPLGTSPWVFVGWRSVADGKLYSPDKLPVVSDGADIYVAEWTAKGNITEDLNFVIGDEAHWTDDNTSEARTTEYDADTKIKLPDAKAISRPGWQLLGWGTSADGSAYWAPGADYIVPASNTTLYAIWSQYIYTIVYDTEGGTYFENKDGVTWRETNILPNAPPTRPGFYFGGWFSGENGTGTKLTDESALCDFAGSDAPREITIYALLVPERADLHYVVSPDGSGTLTVEVEIVNAGDGKPAGTTAKANPGWHFKGWYDKAEGGRLLSRNLSFIPSKSAAGVWFAGTTWYAIFEANTYTVHFDPNGGTGAPDNQTLTYAKSEPLTKATNISKSGCKFLGWNSDKDKADAGEVVYADGAAVTSLAPEGTITLYAVWQVVGYTLAYDPNGGKGEIDKSLTNTYHMVGSDVVLASETDAAVFTRKGYHQTGWDTKPGIVDGDPEYAFGATATMPNSIFVLYAHWVPNTYVLHFDKAGAQGGTHPDEGKVLKYNEAYTLPGIVDSENNSIYTYVGHRFRGWHIDGEDSDDISSSGYYEPGTVVSGLLSVWGGTITLRADWEEIRVGIVWKSDDETKGTVAGRLNAIMWGDTIPNASSNPVIISPVAHMRLSGWTYVMIEDSGEVEGHLDPNGIYGFKVLGPVTFIAHWTDAFVIEYVMGTSGHGNFTEGVEGRTKFSHAVANSGVPAYNGETYDTGLPRAQDGWRFAGWYCEATGQYYYAANISSMVEATSDLVFTALWEKADYYVRFDVNKLADSLKSWGTMVDQGMTFGKTMALEQNNYACTGYTFVGWNTQANGSGTSYLDMQDFLLDSGSTGQIVMLYAQWLRRAYVVQIGNQDTEHGSVTGSDKYLVQQVGYRGNPNEGDIKTTPGLTPETYVNKWRLWGWRWSFTLDDGSVYEGTTAGALHNVEVFGAGRILAIWEHLYDIKYTKGAHGTFTENVEGKTTFTNKSVGTSIPAYAGETNLSGKPTGEDGWVFFGWLTNDGRTFSTWPSYISPTTITMPEGGLILTAQWVKDNSQFIFDPNGGKEVGHQLQTITAATYSQVALPTTGDVERGGYKLLGWAITPDGSVYTDAAGNVYNAGATVLMLPGETTLYAVWEEIWIYVGFDWKNREIANEGSIYSPDGIGSGPRFDGTYYMSVGQASGRCVSWHRHGLDITSSSKDTPYAIGASPMPGYHLLHWVDEQGTIYSTDYIFQIFREADGLYHSHTYYAQFTENDDVIYTFTPNDPVAGWVNRASDPVAPATGTALGSTAHARRGYKFVHWIDENGSVVSTSATFVPSREAAAGNIYVGHSYTAVFAEADVSFSVE